MYSVQAEASQYSGVGILGALGAGANPPPPPPPPKVQLKYPCTNFALEIEFCALIRLQLEPLIFIRTTTFRIKGHAVLQSVRTQM